MVRHIGTDFIDKRQPHISLPHPHHMTAPLPAQTYLFIHALIYSMNMYCEPIYVTGTVPGPGDTYVNKRDQVWALVELTF